MFDISVKAEILFSVFGLPITNAMMGSILVTVLLVLIILFMRTRIRIVPTKTQVVLEGVIMYFQNLLEKTFGSEKMAKRYFPFIASIFIFVIVSNLLGLIPFVSALSYDGISLFREPSSDMSFTIGFAFITVVIANAVGFAKGPFKYIFKFIRINKIKDVRSFGDFFNFLLELFLGFLDIIGEFAKILSMGCRLFGNIFAGGVIIMVMTGLTYIILPSPFYALTILSGVIQAFVYALLAALFLQMGSEVE